MSWIPNPKDVKKQQELDEKNANLQIYENFQQAISKVDVLVTSILQDVGSKIIQGPFSIIKDFLTVINVSAGDYDIWPYTELSNFIKGGPRKYNGEGIGYYLRERPSTCFSWGLVLQNIEEYY